jgi:DNA-binding CsgD family transcriptional regulator
MSTVQEKRYAMRFDDEHAYNQRINDIPTIQSHVIPEHKFRKLVLELSKKHGNINGAYWLIDLICALYPQEFNEQRIIALKQLTQKIFVSYDDVLKNKQICALMHMDGCGPTEISESLNIARNTVYYYLKQNQELPTRCMLTYGEYNLMLDFYDCWEELKRMDQLYGK